LKKRLEQFADANFTNFIIAAWEELRGSRDEPTNTPENVILFKSKLEPRILEQAAFRLVNSES
jgi:predicted nuclease of restriction endonuclease-like RecB superfamily